MLKRVVVLLVVLMMAAASGVQAQTPAPADHGSILAVGGLTFGGGVSSSAFGGELDLTIPILSAVQIYGDVGHLTDIRPASLVSKTGAVVSYLAAHGQTATVTPAASGTYGSFGIRLRAPRMAGNLRPYVVLGGGWVKIEPKVVFTVGGADVTNRLTDYGVQLGTDITGTVTKGMTMFGGGVATSFGRIAVDASYRYTHIATDGGATNVSRLQLGAGVRF
jgi:hypothetical protein